MTEVHIMLDLETWGTTPGSDIRSIGAVVFDPIRDRVYTDYTSDDVGLLDRRKFYVATDNPPGIWRNGEFEPVASSIRRRYMGLTRDPETVKWWNEQSAEAQAAFANPVDLGHGCVLFADWLDGIAYDNLASEDQNLRIWCNDPHFDVAILDAVYRAVGLTVPWHYRAPRSFRTVCELANITREEMQQFNVGTEHNALDDACSQAAIVCEAYRRLYGPKRAL